MILPSHDFSGHGLGQTGVNLLVIPVEISQRFDFQKGLIHGIRTFQELVSLVVIEEISVLNHIWERDIHDNLIYWLREVEIEFLEKFLSQDFLCTFWV